MKKNLLGAALCAAFAVQAQEINPSWYIAPFAAAAKPDRDFGIDKRIYGGGVRFGKPLSRDWDVQFDLSHVRGDDAGTHYDQTLLGGNALWMLSRSNVRPFLLFGVGAQRDRVERPLFNGSKTSPYMTAGIGVQVGLNDQWSMQADLRTVRGRVGEANTWGVDRNNNKYLTVGFNYAFDKPHQAPPPAPKAAPAPAPEPVVEQPAPPPPAPVAPTPPPARFERVTLSATELFEFDSAKLRGDQPKLDEIANALNADNTVQNVMITGHADRLGSSKYNLKLSERRAVSVRDYLVGKGVAASRLSTQGKGESEPVVTCHDKKRSALIKCLEPNRRVVVEQITIERKVQ